jgi:RND family efflux transporter MFP subunit
VIDLSRLRAHRSFRRLRPWCVLGLIAVPLGCGTSTPAAAARVASGSPELPRLEAEVVHVGLASWPTVVRAQGSLVADELTVVGTKVPGRVAEVHIDLGNVVRAGDRLVTLDQSEFRLQIAQVEAQLAQAYSAVGLKPGDDPDQLDREGSPPAREASAIWNKAKADVVRTRQLLAQNAITEIENEQAQMAERVAEAQYASTLNSVSGLIAAIHVRAAELAMARQRLEDTVVFAPFDGIVHQRHVAPGSYVQVGEAMATIVRTNRLRFRATLPERHAHRLAIGQQVRVRVESEREPRVALITRISPVVDELSRALLFEADVDNQDGALRSGLFAEAEVVLDPTAVAITVPPEAVTEFAGVEKVWKVVDGQSREQVVRTGQRREQGIVILEGITAGDVILRNGGQGRPARIVATGRARHRSMTATGGANGAANSHTDHEDVSSQTHSTE